METIISYIDNLFRNYPDTPQVKKAREELLGIMEDKYNELKAEGKSEHEAIGIVISEFGSMEEIAQELGLAEDLSSPEGAAFDDRPKKKLTLEQAKNYIAVQDNFGIKIAIGVVLCIMSPMVASIVEPLAAAGFMPVGLAEAIGAPALFLMVAIAVGLFITSGIASDKYDDYKKSQLILDYGTKTLMTEEYEKFNKVFGTKIAVGVACCIISVIPVGVVDEILGGTSLEWIAEICATSVLAFVSAGVFLFITAGIKQGAYEVLLGKGDYSPEKLAKKKNSKLIRLIGAIYWPVMVAIYLAWSFITNDWGFTWIIWPVAGVVFGGISAVISIAQEK